MTVPSTPSAPPAPGVRALIDGHMLGSAETGNETYIRGLLYGLDTIGRPQAVVLSPAGVCPGRHTTVRLSGSSNLRRLLAALPKLAGQVGAQVIHSTYAVPPATACARVATIHDCSFVAHPEWFTARDRAVLNAGVRWAVRHAERIVVPSHHTRADVLALPGVDAERVAVIAEGVEPRFRPLPADTVAPVLRRLSLERPYVLALGNLQLRKNFLRLLEAWSALVQGGEVGEHVLVLAGAVAGRRDDVAGRVAALRLEGHVRLTGYIAEADLPALYCGATVFVCPSLHEGFGLPVLEAMAAGTPVACAQVTALPETAGDAAAFFDPLDVDEIAATLAGLLADTEARRDLRTRALARALGYTWDDCARRTCEIYEQAAAARGRR
jgi:glycosyltransferase involved in cell wall biosynthesis